MSGTGPKAITTTTAEATQDGEAADGSPPAPTAAPAVPISNSPPPIKPIRMGNYVAPPPKPSPWSAPPPAPPLADVLGEAIRRRTSEAIETSPLPAGHVEIDDAIAALRPRLFGVEAQPPLTRMEWALLNGPGPGLANSEGGSLLPGGVVYIADLDQTTSPEAQAPRKAAAARAYLLRVQDNECERWLAARGWLRRLPDGRDVVPLDRMEATLPPPPASPPAAPAAQGKQVAAGGNASAYHSGMQGRPNSKHMIGEELKRRRAAEEVLLKIAAESNALAKWLKRVHPAAPSCGPSAIRNSFRNELNEAVNEAKARVNRLK